MHQRWQKLWRGLREKFTKTRYTQALELEVARLRAENRAMLNSILGIAGVPPIPAEASEVAAVHSAPGAESGKSSRQARPSPKPRDTGVQMAAPLRRRSWHQINRMLEFHAAHPDTPERTNGSNGQLAGR